MTIFLRTFAAELLKLRRTLAFWLVFLAPGLILALEFLMFHERVDFFAKKQQPLWDLLHRNSFSLWGVLMLPLYVTLQTALLAGLEHSEDRWRSLLAMPVPRWAIYWSKLIIPCLMVVVSSLFLTAGALLNGVVLRALEPRLLFPDPIPYALFFHDAGLTILASLLVVTIHHFISLRLRSFAAATGVGVSATIISFILINSDKYGRLWPWCLPARLLVTRPGTTHDVLVYSIVGAIVVSLAGTWEFSRREIR
ncbi:ABC transporter permease [Paludibaculum fermentans]|uniref:ABC transporter permease n=1 Tax=Paludibaculum fermentans TaxID=1473598 RepID=A0A7S7SLL9_PALFE|nr:ABC transporter permease [Paludibaculum fermentans]QOY90397.1 ABC transporter permease [Paludibaculum fermentans]